MNARVTLKQGATYRIAGHVFTASPSYVSDPVLIEQLQKVGALLVVLEGAPPKPVVEVLEPVVEVLEPVVEVLEPVEAKSKKAKKGGGSV